MKLSNQLKGWYNEVSFGYHSKLDGYATLMSDIPPLGESALFIEDAIFLRGSGYGKGIRI